MAVEITAQHLNWLTEDREMYLPGLRAALGRYEQLLLAVQTNPVHPPEPQWSDPAMAAQREALRAQIEETVWDMFMCAWLLCADLWEVREDWTA